MGNKTSSNNNSKETGFDEEPSDLSLEDKLDFIATHYILTMDFNSLRKLYEKEYYSHNISRLLSLHYIS